MAVSSAFRNAFVLPRPTKFFALCVLAEFFGTLLFQFISALVSGSSLATGLTYSVLVFATQNESGAHLNPAISLALMLSGHLNLITGFVYIIAQILGAICGALLEVAVVPSFNTGVDPGEAAGCFSYLGTNLNNYQILGWEFLFTLALVWVYYTCAVAPPGHGSVGPLAFGLTIYIANVAAQKYLERNLALNPARLLGPASVFHCAWKSFWIYLFAELLAAAATAALACLSGVRGTYGAAVAAAHETAMGATPLDTLREPLIAPSNRFVLQVPEQPRSTGAEAV